MIADKDIIDYYIECNTDRTDVLEQIALQHGATIKDKRVDGDGTYLTITGDWKSYKEFAKVIDDIVERDAVREEGFSLTHYEED